MKKIALAIVFMGGIAAATPSLAQSAAERITFENDVLGEERSLLTMEASLSEEACRQLAGYRAGQGNEATYRAGVDVDGNPVIEADIGNAAIPVPKEIRFRLSVDMAEYLGLSSGGGPNPAGYIDFGEVSILPDGQVFLDGQPMESQPEAALRALCDEGKTP